MASKTISVQDRESISPSLMERQAIATYSLEISYSASVAVRGDEQRSQSAPPGLRVQRSDDTKSCASSFVTATEEVAEEQNTTRTRTFTIANIADENHWSFLRGSRPAIRRLTATQQVILQAFNWTQSRDPGQISSAQALLKHYDAHWSAIRQTITAEVREQWATVARHWANAKKEALKQAILHEREVQKVAKYLIIEYVPVRMGGKHDRYLAELLIRFPAATKEADNGFVWHGELVHRRFGVRTWIVEYATAAQATVAASELREPVREFCKKSLPGRKEIQVHRLGDRMAGQREWARSVLEQVEGIPGAEEARAHVKARQESEVWVVGEMEKNRVERTASGQVWYAAVNAIEQQASGEQELEFEVELERRLSVVVE